jgi:aryl-alcohol dehydrogenase-like predicted oxidoreductase
LSVRRLAQHAWRRRAQGSSGEIVGRALKDFADRDAVVIATKVRHPMRPGPKGSSVSRKASFAEIEHSLRQLGTDYVDLYQIHRIDTSTPIVQTLQDLHDVVKAGKARYHGAVSMHAWQFSKVLHLQRQHSWARSSRCRATTTCSPARRSGRCWRCAPPRGSARSCGARSPAAASPAREKRPHSLADMLYTQEASDRAVIDAVAAIASARGVSRSQVSLAWLRHNPVVIAPARWHDQTVPPGPRHRLARERADPRRGGRTQGSSL